MAHLIQPATTGRSKCRACGDSIAAGELRFGEVRPNPFGDGDATSWFHLECGAYKRPEPFLELLEAESDLPDRARELSAEVQRGIEHPRLDRIAGAQRAPSGRARCRACRELIEKETWRVALTFHAEGRFEAGGFIHASCAPAYFKTDEVQGRIRHFSRDLSDDDARDIEALLG